MKRLLVLAGVAILASSAALAQQYEYRYSKEGRGPTPAEPSSCSLPWGGLVGNGDVVEAFASAEVAFGFSCIAETRSCVDGDLSGTFGNQNCQVQPGLACSAPWGAMVQHEDSIQAFVQEAVAWDQTCVGEVRQCYNGTLSGSYSFGGCAVAQQDRTPAPFVFTGQAGIMPSTMVMSNAVQILEIEGSVDASVGGPSAQFRTCTNSSCSSGATSWATSAQVTSGRYLQVRMPSSATLGANVVASVSVGTFSTTWSVSTATAICSAYTSPSATLERFNTVQQLANNICQFNAPVVQGGSTAASLAPDVKSGELYCARMMGPQGRLAGFGLYQTDNGPIGASRNGTAFITQYDSQTKASSVRCTTVDRGCSASEWFDGTQCRPVPTVSCAQIVSDTNHQFEQKHADVAIGRCAMGRIKSNNYYAYDGSTLLNFAATLQGISGAVVQSATPYSNTGGGYLIWRSPTAAKVGSPSGTRATLYLDIADPVYGAAGTLPADIPGF